MRRSRQYVNNKTALIGFSADHQFVEKHNDGLTSLTKEELEAFSARKQAFIDCDQKNGYILERDEDEYEKQLIGLHAFFDYIRSGFARAQLESNRVADIGAGKARAITQIANGPLGKGIECIATTLNDMREGAETVPLYVTSAEELEGIATNSLGGILSVFGITYTAFPRVVVKTMDNRLVGGGILKTIVRGKEPDPTNLKTWEFFQRVEAKSVDDFLPHFHELGYSTAVFAFKNGDVLYAVKPGGAPGRTAQELLEADLRIYYLSYCDWNPYDMPKE